MKNSIRSDVIILGGGLAGLLTAIKLSRANVQVTLIDNSLPEASGKLGGFASFSGAKFSLPPAGMGLLPLVGSEEALNEIIEEVLSELGLSQEATHTSSDYPIFPLHQSESGYTYRKYQSVLLSPDGILDLLTLLKSKLPSSCHVIRGSADDLARDGGDWMLNVSSQGQDELTITAPSLFYAAGRLSSDLLINAGATPCTGKGLDVGVRFEMLSLSGLEGLRALGADAKIIINNCRTFCLNSPGLIYRYPFKSITIPGGVVADAAVTNANVGVLLRLSDKQENLERIENRATKLYADIINASNAINHGPPFGELSSLINDLYGHEVSEEISQFCYELGRLGLINWSVPYKVHLPLIDWHWPTFSNANSHKTSLENVYAVGDSSGHARGLLQAALSGWIAAGEYLNV